MPKIVDHEARRKELLQATWRVIARLGLEGTTVREIAKESGYSNGVLAHYFESKDDIIISAHRLAFQNVFDRAHEANKDRRGIEAIRYALYEALPLDPERFLEAVIDVSYWGQALVNRRLNDVRRASVSDSRGWWIAMISDAREAGEVTTEISDEVLIDQIKVLIDGVSVQAVMYPEDMTPERQMSIADAFVAMLGPAGTAPGSADDRLTANRVAAD
jgi:AcrR family transcriptional regulator